MVNSTEFRRLFREKLRFRLEHVWGSPGEIEIYNRLAAQVVREPEVKAAEPVHVCSTYSYGEVIEPWLDEYI